MNDMSSTPSEVAEAPYLCVCGCLLDVHIQSSTTAGNRGREHPTRRLIWGTTLKGTHESGETDKTPIRSENDSNTTDDSEYETENSGWWSRWDDSTVGTVTHSSSPGSETGEEDSSIPRAQYPSTSCSSPVEETAGLTYGDSPVSKDPETTSFLCLISHTAPTRALLTTLELISTEYSYLSSLRMLLIPGATLTPPPPLMVSYMKDLVRASEDFLWEVDDCVKKMEEVGGADGYESDDTAEGDGEISVGVVARAFLRAEEKIGMAMVRWCGVVGHFFVGSADVRKGPGRRLSKRQTVDDHIMAQSPATPTKANVWSLRLSSPTGCSITGAGPPRHAQCASRNVKADGLNNKINRSDFRTKMGVRDYAILPTQRVMRYVLLFKG
jgi:hypothetical protein